jgi:hypothetical protein
VLGSRELRTTKRSIANNVRMDMDVEVANRDRYGYSGRGKDAGKQAENIIVAIIHSVAYSCTTVNRLQLHKTPLQHLPPSPSRSHRPRN